MGQDSRSELFLKGIDWVVHIIQRKVARGTRNRFRSRTEIVKSCGDLESSLAREVIRVRIVFLRDSCVRT